MLDKSVGNSSFNALIYSPSVKASVADQKAGALDNGVTNVQSGKAKYPSLSKRFKRAIQQLFTNKPALTERNIKASSDVVQHKILRGVRVWLSSMSNDKHGFKPTSNDGTALKPEQLEREAFNRAGDLFSECREKGDVILLSFGKGRHSALLVFDDSINKPKYISFGAPGYCETASRSEDLLVDDMLAYGDLFGKSSGGSNNIVKLKGMNGRAMIKCWDNNYPLSSFNPLWNNCSSATRDVLLAGAKGKIEANQLKHNRHWQMPANTHALALEIKAMLPSPLDLSTKA